MIDSSIIAKATLLMIDSYYPIFLTEAKETDSPTTKVGFYGAMIAACAESPSPFPEAQQIVMDELSRLHNLNMETLKNQILNNLLNK